MCIDLRGSYIQDHKEIEYLLKYGNNLTLEDIKIIAFNKDEYYKALNYAVQNENIID